MCIRDRIKDPNKYKLIPQDVTGSWSAVLHNISVRETSAEQFEWELPEDYERSKARRSPVMHRLIRDLAQTAIRENFIIGGNLFGVALALPNFKESNQLISINVTVDRKIELRRLDVTGNTIRPMIICESVHNFAAAGIATINLCRVLELETSNKGH